LRTPDLSLLAITPVSIAASLLNHFLKLLTDYRAIEAIDGDACHAEVLM
jgi:hypothetical protein